LQRPRPRPAALTPPRTPCPGRRRRSPARLRRLPRPPPARCRPTLTTSPPRRPWSWRFPGSWAPTPSPTRSTCLTSCAEHVHDA
ncbi:hypothetical protein HMPREF0058_1809, partial [Actinomyces urogenitalis DSM 15434]